jgi:glycosyltransferase involved in cell wall biosynthesis
VPWRELPTLLWNADINLAPLERNNRFTECKSEVKYLEAGLLGIPTVASNIGGFKNAIQSGRNGILCTTDEEWLQALEQLIGHADLREQIGRCAREDILSHHTTRMRSVELGTVIGTVG